MPDLTSPHLTPHKHAEFGIRRLPHRPYSQDIVPCDFWLFDHLKQYLAGRVFDDEIASKVRVTQILMSIESDVFVRVFDEWSSDCGNAWIEEGIIYEQAQFDALSQDFQGLCLRRTDLMPHPLPPPPLYMKIGDDRSALTDCGDM
jgi:hypothetical protein